MLQFSDEHHILVHAIAKESIAIAVDIFGGDIFPSLQNFPQDKMSNT